MTPLLSHSGEEKIIKIFLRAKFVFIILAFVASTFSFIVLNSPQPAVYAVEQYTLPYPGILSTHPLYRLKKVRDSLREIFTRDPAKKAELYLLLADKHVNAAFLLVEKEKNWEMAALSALEAEQQWAKVRSNMTDAKKMGVSPSLGFVNILQSSVEKHRVVLEKLRKKAPLANKTAFKDALTMNKEFSVWLLTQK